MDIKCCIGHEHHYLRTNERLHPALAGVPRAVKINALRERRVPRFRAAAPCSHPSLSLSLIKKNQTQPARHPHTPPDQSQVAIHEIEIGFDSLQL
jgi:hypothetical protein